MAYYAEGYNPSMQYANQAHQPQSQHPPQQIQQQQYNPQHQHVQQQQYPYQEPQQYHAPSQPRYPYTSPPTSASQPEQYAQAAPTGVSQNVQAPAHRSHTYPAQGYQPTQQTPPPSHARRETWSTPTAWGGNANSAAPGTPIAPPLPPRPNPHERMVSGSFGSGQSSDWNQTTSQRTMTNGGGQTTPAQDYNKRASVAGSSLHAWAEYRQQEAQKNAIHAGQGGHAGRPPQPFQMPVAQQVQGHLQNQQQQVSQPYPQRLMHSPPPPPPPEKSWPQGQQPPGDYRSWTAQPPNVYQNPPPTNGYPSSPPTQPYPPLPHQNCEQPLSPPLTAHNFGALQSSPPATVIPPYGPGGFPQVSSSPQQAQSTLPPQPQPYEVPGQTQDVARPVYPSGPGLSRKVSSWRDPRASTATPLVASSPQVQSMLPTEPQVAQQYQIPNQTQAPDQQAYTGSQSLTRRMSSWKDPRASISGTAAPPPQQAPSTQYQVPVQSQPVDQPAYSNGPGLTRRVSSWEDPRKGSISAAVAPPPGPEVLDWPQAAPLPSPPVPSPLMQPLATFSPSTQPQQPQIPPQPPQPLGSVPISPPAQSPPVPFASGPLSPDVPSSTPLSPPVPLASRALSPPIPRATRPRSPPPAPGSPEDAFLVSCPAIQPQPAVHRQSPTITARLSPSITTDSKGSGSRTPLPKPPSPESLVAEFGGLGVSSSPKASSSAPPEYTPASSSRTVGDDDDLAAADLDKVKVLPRLLDSGTPAPRMFCPDSLVLTPETWYHANGHSDEVLMCSACYHELVAGSLMTKNFTSKKLSVGACLFKAPAVRRQLRVSRRSGSSARTAIEAVIKRKGVKRCLGGGVGIDSTAGVEWYRVQKTSQPGGLLACQACHTDYVDGTRWASEWVPESQPLGWKFTCDLGMKFGQRSFGKMLGTASRDPAAIDKWITGMQRRKALPVCTGDLPVVPIRWWKPTDQYRVDELAICDTCYHDHFAYTRFAGGFEPALEFKQQSTVCHMADPAILAATGLVAKHSDMALWVGVVSAIMPWILHPPSNKKDNEVRSGRKQLQVYFTLRGPPVDIDICAKCYHSRFGPFGVARYFVQQQLPTIGRSCDVCSFGKGSVSLPDAAVIQSGVNFRGASIVNRVAEAAEIGIFSHFDSFIEVLTTLPPCKERMGVKNGTWYGFPEMPVCTTCWLSFGSTTNLGSRAMLGGQAIAAERVCALYSPRMRAAVLEWGDQPPAKADAVLANLLALGKKRSEIWTRCMKPWIEYQTLALAQGTAGASHGEMDALEREWSAVE